MTIVLFRILTLSAGENLPALVEFKFVLFNLIELQGGRSYSEYAILIWFPFICLN